MYTTELILYPVLFLYCWFTSFLWHELWHIKGKSLLHTGNIQVFKGSMAAYRDNIDVDGWFYLSGGLLSGLLHITLGLLIKDTILQFCLLNVGFINLCYGFFEYWFLPKWGDNWKYKIGRYTIYIGVIIVMIIIKMII